MRFSAPTFVNFSPRRHVYRLVSFSDSNVNGCRHSLSPSRVSMEIVYFYGRGYYIYRFRALNGFITTAGRGRISFGGASARPFPLALDRIQTIYIYIYTISCVMVLKIRNCNNNNNKLNYVDAGSIALGLGQQQKKRSKRNQRLSPP